MNDEFMGMTEYVVESFHDLLVGESDRPSTLTLVGEPSPLARMFHGRYPEGYSESIHEGGATPIDELDAEVKGYVGAPPRLWVEQLRA